MFTRKFWADVIERTVKTFAQTLAGSLVGVNVLTDKAIPFGAFLLGAGIAAAIAFLMGVAGSQVGSTRTAAWLPKDLDSERGHATSEVVLVALVTAAATTLLLLLLVDKI